VGQLPDTPVATPRPPRATLAALALFALLTAATIVSGCAASAGGGVSAAASSSSPSAAASSMSSPAALTPTPVPSPQITAGAPPRGAVDVARRWWGLLSQNRLAEARALVAPGSPLDLHWGGPDTIRKAHLVAAEAPVLEHTLKPDETVQFPVKVFVKPRLAVGNWNGPGVYVQYMGFVRMSDGSWRVYETGTGP
jgi:hypothetical protein